MHLGIWHQHRRESPIANQRFLWITYLVVETAVAAVIPVIVRDLRQFAATFLADVDVLAGIYHRNLNNEFLNRLLIENKFDILRQSRNRQFYPLTEIAKAFRLVAWGPLRR